jgi:hypothetical protein
MLVRDLYQDSIIYEEIALVYCLFHLLAESKISLDDDTSKIDLYQADRKKVAEIIQKNPLGLNKVGVYSLKMDLKTFVFIYASSQEEAVQFYNESFQNHPLNCHEYPLEFQLISGKEVVSFRDMKKEFNSFPAIAGYFLKEKG